MKIFNGMIEMKIYQQMDFLFLLLCLILLPIQITHAATQPPVPVGRVVWIKGNLKAIMENKEERTLQNKSIIYLHDTLVTDASSKAQVGFTDQTMMTFRENTTFKIDKYQYNPGSKSSGAKSAMSLVEGGFRTITGAISKNAPNNYEVNTPVATIGVRGTEYQTYHQGETTYIGFYNGTPCIRLRQQTCDDYKRRFPEKAKQIDEENKNKKGDKVICLNKQVRWVKVVGPCGNPEPMDEKPDAIKDDLEINQTYIEPFNFGGGVGGGKGGTNDFCIQ